MDEELYLGKVRLVRTDLAGHAFGERVLEFNRPARSHREWKLEDEIYCAAGRVRVNTLDPGPVRSPIHLRSYPGEDARQRLGPEAVVPAYLYLLGPDSRRVNGQALSAQG